MLLYNKSQFLIAKVMKIKQTYKRFCKKISLCQNILLFRIKKETLNLAVFVIGEIIAVGDYHMVGKVQTHGVAGFLYVLCKAVVVAAGRRAAAWVIVYKRKYGGIANKGFAQDNTHIDGSLGDASATYGNDFY